MNTNPYTSPQTAFANQEEETYQPSVLSFSGRIGRLRYLAYSIPWNLLIWVGIAVIGIVAAIIIPMLGENAETAGVIVGILLALILVVVVYIPVFALAVRRLNDMNQSGWLSLLILLPFINFIFMLVLIFAPGTKGTNKYGPQPVKNSGLVIFGALIFPLGFGVLGILAAVALPAYQDYTIRAQVSEALMEVAEVRLKVEDYAQQYNEFPAQNSDIDHNWRSDSPRVQSIDVMTGGVITLVLDSDNLNLQGKTIVFRPSDENDFIEWDCTGGDLEPKYRPSLCRP